MTRFIPLPMMLSAVVLLGCHYDPTPENRCLAELGALPITDSVTIDIEQQAGGIVGALGAEPYWADIPTIATDCQAPTMLPDQLILSTAQGLLEAAPKPVQVVSVPSLSGVIFVYRSQGEEEVVTGLAAALVEYRQDGKPGQVYKAAEALRDEGWGRVVSSTVEQAAVQRCSQEIEYFRYADNGDVIGELDTPVRTPRFCEHVLLLSFE